MNYPGYLKEKLKDNGWRLTVQRETIFLVFQSLPKGNHLSAEEVLYSLLMRGQKINLSTVYRNLKLMTRMGILRELELTQGAKKYELNSDSFTHHHIVCIQCNQTIEFENNSIIKQSLQQVQESGLKLVDCQLVLYTICPEAIEMGWPASLPNNWLCSRYLASQQIEDVKADQRNKLRIEFKENRVVVYAPHELNESDSFKQKAKSIQGWRYCRDDFGWYFPLDKAVEALNVLHEGCETEPKFEKAIALIKQQQAQAPI
jgi:Fur family transcriptional regulator, ferric uptake regulator